MASNFSSLRKSRTSLLAKLADTAKQQSSKQTRQDDPRFWKLTTDPKTGIGYTRLRFLPPAKGEELSWVRIFNHGFQGPSGSWFIENCPTTLNNLPCPVCLANRALYNSGVAADKLVAGTRKRKLSYNSNILVIEDPAHKENDGKVFVFRYGKKIHDKIMELIEPKFPDREPSNPFDIWEGADFKLKAQKVAGFPNYDNSSFDEASELFVDEKDKEARQEEIWNQEIPLAEFTDEKLFKTYEALDQRFKAVLSGTGAPATAAAAVEQEQVHEPQDDETPTAAKPVRTPRAIKKQEPVAEAKPVPPADEDEEALNDFFNTVLDDEK